MDIQVLLTPFAWLQLNSEMRNGLSKAFGLRSSTSPRCVTQNGVTKIESDGKTVEDLMGMNAESMQKWLGFTTIDPEADIHALLGMCADKMEAELHPPVEEVVTVESVTTTATVKPFCDFCASKGVRHLKACTREHTV